jgi:hypothetical protein
MHVPFALSPTLWLVVNVAAVFRLTRLVCTDQITAPARQRVLRWAAQRGERQDTLIADFLACPWCVSPWLAAGVVALAYYVPQGWTYVAYVLTCSAVAGIVAERT